MRKSVMPWLACALIALVAIPAFASGAVLRSSAPAEPTVASAPVAAPTVTFKTTSASLADGTIIVGDNFFHEAGEPIEDNEVQINAGEKVSFIQEDSHQPHNVAFTGEQPASCTQLTGNPVDTNTTSPMPDQPQGPSWTGECRFTSGGTYDFVCIQHPDMTGKVQVEGGTTPTPTPTATPGWPAAPGFVARDGGVEPYWFQDVSSTDPSDHSVTIQAGGTVNFGYPVGSNYHNVDFRLNAGSPSGSGPQPTSCVQTAGNTVGTVPPLPNYIQPPGWAGRCTFETPGTYFFVCSAHLSMTGTVIVEDDTPTPPETTIDSGPTGTTNQTSANFTFSSDQTAATFECKLDRPGSTGTYAACSSPAAFTTTTNGAYTFSVRAVLSGTPDPTPATRSFTVDTGPPDTTINGGPSGTVNTTSQSFQFSGTELGSTFECRLDTPSGNGSFSACTSPQAYTTTANGAYTFHVRARDAAGNVDASPATRAFTVDTAAPDTTITGGPTGTTNNASPSFTFTASESGSSFECRLDGPGSTTGTYVACTSPRAVGPLTDGTYTFNVRARDAAGNQDASAATRTFTVETAAPDTAITGGPSGTTNATNASFTFTSTKPGSTFECRLDTPSGNGSFSACTSPQAYTTTANGAYTFHVRAIDSAGNPDGSPATRSFTVDTTAPNTTIDSGPTGTITSNSPQFTFSASESGSTFECRLDAGSTPGTWQSCTSPRILGSLADGAYTFNVRATDAAGNVDATPATRTFTVDATAPNTTIDSGPTGTITTASPQFTFSASESGSTFECRLDGPGSSTGSYAACTSPRTLGPLADGTYTFLVRASDGAGNVDASPASRTFTVDAAAPDTTITSGPTGTTNSTSASFAFTSSESGSTFECRLDSAAFAPCTSPQAYSNLSNGEHTFSVRAKDAAGNVDASPASRTFTVDTVAPDTTIASGPSGPTNAADASFAFTSEPGATFECRLDSAAYAPCTSPRAYSNLTDGEHTFSVRATDAAGNVDATPATRTFTVDTAAPDTTINSGPTGATNDASPAFTFSGTELGATFECRLDSAAYGPCTSPQAYSNLANGEHTFSVRAKDAAGNVDASPATRTFTVDTVAPDTTIDSGPSGTINTASPEVTFSANQSGSSFECRLDGPGSTTGTYVSCTSPRTLGPLVDGTYTFSVRASDAAGNVDATPATRTFTVETSVPDTSITGGPAGATNNTSPSFTFESTKPNSTFECRLDSAAFAPCTSPQAYTNLADGEHTFSVRARDAAGNVDASPASRTFTVDTAAPNTTIDSGPSGTIGQTSASFTFSASETGSTFECRLDSAAFAPCTSPQAYTNLTSGEHTFSVRAKDAVGNVDASPATRTFTVDSTAPDTTITAGPTGATGDASPSFAFESSKPGSTFECRLDSAAFAPCTSPQAYTNLADGEHTFAVRAKDTAGNVDDSPATRTFTVDTAAPDTTIDSGPTGTTGSSSASFTFSSSESGSTFECKLDSAAFAPCTSPQAYTALANGEHTFSVRAKDAAGNVDATPATRTFTVDATAPDTTITGGPSGPTGSTSASFTFESTKPNSTFECRLDSAAFAPCTSPQAYTNLAEGQHTFAVRAKDAAGTVDATPATRTFTVDAAAPDTTITGGPSGPIAEHTQTFTFTSEASATFECRLDRPAGQGTFEPCTSPRQYTEAALGDYTFHVRARDAQGNVDATPATRSFRIDPEVTPTPTPTEVTEESTVSGIVPTTLGLTVSGTAEFPPFVPGVSAEYTANLTALITSSAANAQLTVVDGSGVHPGRMVNGSYVLTDPLQVRATNAAQPNSPFGALSATSRQLLAYTSYVAADPVTIAFRQTVRATEALLAGAYEKTLTFTLSTTQP